MMKNVMKTIVKIKNFVVKCESDSNIPQFSNEAFLDLIAETSRLFNRTDQSFTKRSEKKTHKQKLIASGNYLQGE